MTRGGYTHGKRSDLPPKPRYIEDRLGDLEKLIDGLLTLVRRSLEREQSATNSEIAKIESQIRDYREGKRKSALKKRKPIKRQRKKSL